MRIVNELRFGMSDDGLDAYPPATMLHIDCAVGLQMSDRPGGDGEGLEIHHNTRTPSCIRPRADGLNFIQNRSKCRLRKTTVSIERRMAKDDRNAKIHILTKWLRWPDHLNHAEAEVLRPCHFLFHPCARKRVRRIQQDQHIDVSQPVP